MRMTELTEAFSSINFLKKIDTTEVEEEEHETEHILPQLHVQQQLQQQQLIVQEKEIIKEPDYITLSICLNTRSLLIVIISLLAFNTVLMILLLFR